MDSGSHIGWLTVDMLEVEVLVVGTCGSEWERVWGGGLVWGAE